ncbi:glycosyltransferase family 2 protein [Pseudoponticoccus marisrubri]|uniref:Glycosyl transferase n=1 Tax=Pseudoponticoccus marisrubri TaxID=1685382 RepID=A0A0W7WJ79_9RHOB|nr:glycosyltransferase [Pseudoponticoccus marisrubri]KUF10667.1 glycosyl transferase [Pseudoponticoccus marisrubri]
MPARPVSVVVVSRGRPAALARCVAGIAQLDYAPLEVVVVACPEGQAVVRGWPENGGIKLVPFDRPNISQARNLGVAQAAGELVAFIDDDAVPEPLWLRHLVSPFDRPEVAAAGGYVIGRNGISFQWTARSIDQTGEAHALALAGTDPAIPDPGPGRATKTEGTNMAVRRAVLARLGGFDPAFAFYLDETDLNMRIAEAGLATAIVPLAQVHHGFAESPRRAPDRTPRDLSQIAASKQVFLRKHCPASEHAEAWATFHAAQRARLLRAMQRGPLAPDDVMRLLAGLDRGAHEGAQREIDALPELPDPPAFQDFGAMPGAPHEVLAGRSWQADTLRAQAADMVGHGATVTLFLLSPTARPHRVRFTATGVWEQSGGLFGRSRRDASFFRYWRFSARIEDEMRRLVPVRGHMSYVKTGQETSCQKRHNKN